MRCDISAAQFWEMTPYETFLSIDAYLGRARQQQRERIRTAWLTAALTRARRLPSLARLLQEPARSLHGEELLERRREFEEMSQNIDLEVLNAKRTR